MIAFAKKTTTEFVINTPTTPHIPYTQVKLCRHIPYTDNDKHTYPTNGSRRLIQSRQL